MLQIKRFLDVYLFPTLKKGEGEATFHEEREENLHLGKKVGNFHVSQQLLSMIVGLFFYLSHSVEPSEMCFVVAPLQSPLSSTSFCKRSHHLTEVK